MMNQNMNNNSFNNMMNQNMNDNSFNNMMNQPMMSNINHNLNNIQGTSIQTLKKIQKEENPPSIASKSHNSNHSSNTNLSLNDKIIDTLVTDVNASFDDYSPSDEKEHDTETEKEKDEKINYNKIIEYLYEPILLLVIYIILSQEKIRDTFIKYIPLLNPTDEGEIKLAGIILYGIILVGLFMLSKKILLNK